MGKTVFLNLVILLMCTEIILNQEVDTDNDGLSDFQETHKYLTNPNNADSDGDGISDGDWNERREYAYSIRTILRFMHPFDEDALNDNFQDANVLEQEDYYTEMEVIHYPFSSAENSIVANPNWQQDYAGMTEYLQPGITANWDAGMKQDLLDELEADGIVINNLTDKQVVEQVSSWLLNNYTALGVFTTYYIYYPNGQPEVYPGLEDAYEEEFYSHGYEINWPIEEHFEHELLGKGMYYNKTRGTCTSTAVALTTVLRAVGIPTRMIIVIPIVDASNPSQSQLVEQGINNGQVRQTILDWLSGAGTGFSAHTFNEVYVGNQWHRLNYNKLGQPILDEHCFGLHTHLYTFNDLSEANLATTWGWRFGKSIRNDVFGYSNPYTTMLISDLLIQALSTLYVDDDAPGDPGPGNPEISDPCEDGSILHTYDSIQQAIDVAEYDNTTIIIQPGTYTRLGNRDIDFRGLPITVSSTDPNNPNVVAATIIDCQGSVSEPCRGFYFHNSEGSDSILDGVTITNGYAYGNWPDDSGGGIACYRASPTIKNCMVTNNTAQHHGGGIYSFNSSPRLINCMLIANSAGWNGGGMHNGPSSPNLNNCIFADNTSGSYGGGLSTTSDSNPTLNNCTFSVNSGSTGGAIAVYNSNTLLTNCILWGNIPNQVYVAAGNIPIINYSNVQGGYGGTGNINCDPLFANASNGDYHLKSEAGRWDPNSESWIIDAVTSPCIDAGDSGSNWTAELWPHGKCINMGAFGGTPQASISSSDAGNVADVSNNGLVDYTDLMMLTNKWLYEEALLSEDLNRNGFVNFTDFAIFANEWLWQE